MADLFAEQDDLPGEADARLAAENNRSVSQNGTDDVEVGPHQGVKRIEGPSAMEQIPT